MPQLNQRFQSTLNVGCYYSLELTMPKQIKERLNEKEKKLKRKQSEHESDLFAL